MSGNDSKIENNTKDNLPEEEDMFAHDLTIELCREATKGRKEFRETVKDNLLGKKRIERGQRSQNSCGQKTFWILFNHGFT